MLREDILPELGLSKVEVASVLGNSRQHLCDIPTEKKPVSPEIAARLGKAFGDGAQVWLRMQAAFDARQAERNVDVSRVRSLRAA